MSALTLHEIELRAVDPPYAWAKGHVEQYLASGGEETDHPRTDRLILFYTTGRRSGEIRRTPLVHVEWEGTILIVASQGGAPTHPSWYRNLLADPRVWVRRRQEFFEARARVLGPEERGRAWEAIVDVMGFFADYQAKTERVIPVVALERVGRAAAG